MSFLLTPLQSEDSETFSTKEILELLGDPINDEILIKGKPYRLSSFIGLGAEDIDLNNFVLNEEEIVVPAIHNNQFTIINPFRPDKSLVFINGINYRHGVNKDFHVMNKNLIWHGQIDLAENDTIVIRYLDYNV